MQVGRPVETQLGLCEGCGQLATGAAWGTNMWLVMASLMTSAAVAPARRPRRAGRRLRADAARNRRRLLDAAAEVFAEQGLDVAVAEIAQRAGIGRGTLFRNFPSKQSLIAAIVVERMRCASDRGRALLDASQPREALFGFLDGLLARRHIDRALLEAVDGSFLANEEIHSAYAELVGVLEALLYRAQQAGTVRRDVGAVDLLMLLKGICEAARAFGGDEPRWSERHLDLVLAAVSPGAAVMPLRGTAPTVADLTPE